MKKILCAVSLLLPIITHADGPFGIEIGSDISALNGCTPADSPGLYTCSSVPKMHSAFQLYAVRTSPSLGVCFVKAIGKEISDNGYGISTKNTVDEIAGQMALNYGKHTDHSDFLVAGSIWDDGDDWMMGLRQSDRFYSYEWDPESGYSPKNNVNKIYVFADALSSNTGLVQVEFYGDNFEACKEENASSEASAF